MAGITIAAQTLVMAGGGGISLLRPLILSSLLLQFAFLSQATSPFGFVKQLQGCRKGDKMEGIHKVKKYLQRFGYMNSTKYQTEEASDDFDDELESAIKDFQNFYKLEPTGSLDAPTAGLMSRPRCGVPDNQKAGRISPNFAFFDGQPKWPPEFRNMAYLLPDSPHPEAGGAVQNAFNAWAGVSSFRFQRTQDSRNALLSLSFQVRDHGDGFTFDGPRGILAHAFPPSDGRLHFDGDETWAVGSVDGAFDIQTVATHEIGHLLGLAHSQSKDAVMFATIEAGEIKGIAQDDIDGIRTLYAS